MKLFNAQTQRIEPFQPAGRDVSLYAGGITPQEPLQLDQAFTCCAIDVLVRYLDMKEYRVRYAQYVTGIDNDISNNAQAIEEDGWSSGDHGTRPSIQDMQSLNVRPPDYLSQATEALPQIIRKMQTRLPDRRAYLLFPCQESILNQNEGTEKRTPFVSFWWPSDMVRYGGQKGHQSRTNRVAVRDLLPHYSPDVLRIYLAQHHYRRPWTFDEVKLGKAADCFERLNAALLAASTGRQPINITPAENRFVAAMDNDLDSVKGIASLLNLADEILFRAANGYRIDEAQAALRRMARVLGLRLDDESTADRIKTGRPEYGQQLIQ